MKEKDLNKIAGIEKAITKKYGKEAVQNPKSNWNRKKEKSFIQSVKKFYSRTLSNLKRDFKVASQRQQSKCQICGKEEYFFKAKDELTYLKWGVCNDCYINKIEDREEQWLNNLQQDKESVFEK